jgi:hypothetical protein
MYIFLSFLSRWLDSFQNILPKEIRRREPVLRFLFLSPCSLLPAP